MSKQGTKKKKLSVVTSIQLILLTAVLFLAICLIVGHVVERETMNIYKDFAFSYTNTVAKNINPDVIEAYQKTGKTDAYWDKIEKLLVGMVHDAELRYLYVFVPEEEGIRYVWDAQLDDDSRPLNDIWYYDGDYPQQEAMEAYCEGKEWFTTYYYGDMAMAAAISPLKDHNGKTVALVETDILMPRIRSNTWIILAYVGISVSIIMGTAMAGFYVFLKKRILRPLQLIQVATDMMVENLEKDEIINIDVHTRDEIEDVARSFEDMDRRLHTYIRENNRITVERERVSAELNLATKLQADMLPNVFPAFPERKEFDIYADMTPAKEVGGDFYDFFITDQDHLAVVMADVSGKGIPAAMFMMMTKSMIQSRMVAGGDPGTVLEDVNNMICANNRERMFVTVWLGVLDLQTGVLTATNAGHEKPLIKKPGGSFEVFKDEHGFVLGGKKKMKYPNYELQMEPGSMLFLYTDGVTESTDENEEQFGRERMLQAINSMPETKPYDVLKLVDRNVQRFVGEAEQFDDLTMLCVLYNGPQGNAKEIS
ncbi:MAG: SpoIIE family protein phosphatase [Lachnospiraceae bacterium]|nr:SpoIIE family protein phosphatase [Lachnospiraceae bacterium]